MPIEKGQIFTPEKKGALVQEVQNEVSKLDEALRKKSFGATALQIIKENRDKLLTILNLLSDKKGVVTPQETDDILDAIGNAKRSRLETQYYLGIKTSTIYLILFLGLGAGVYFYMKKRTQ
jgi:hypothetical protein